MISQSTIDEVKERASLLEIVGETVQLKRQGVNYTGRCPFHNEKSPSFNIRESDQYYHCFGCGKSGNVFSYIMETRGLTFPEAVEELASRYGIEVKREGERGRKPSADSRKEEYYQINHLAHEFFVRSLESADPKVVEYVRSRGLRREAIREFGIGFAPSTSTALTQFLRGKKIDDELLVTSGLVRRNSRGEFYDGFRGRLVFPIWIDSRKIAGFGGRIIPLLVEPDVLKTLPKYLNSPETPIYHKSRILYGLPQAMTEIRQKGEVYIVEGYMDVVGLHQAGVKNVLATCGTALTSEHVRKTARLAKRIVVLFDGDAAGKSASAKSFLTFLNAAVDVWALFLPEGEDPDSVAATYREKTGEYLASLDRVALIDCYIDSLIRSYGVTEVAALGPASIGNLSQEVTQALVKVDDPIVRDQLLERAAFRLRVKSETLADMVSKGAKDRKDGTVREGLPLEIAKEAAVEIPRLPLMELPRLDQELLIVVMGLREKVTDTVLRDPVLVEALHPATLQFVEALDRILCETTLSDELKKEQTRNLLSDFGESWKSHWKKAFEMQASGKVKMEMILENCRESARKNKTNLLVKQIQAEMARTDNVDAKAELSHRMLELLRGAQAT